MNIFVLVLYIVAAELISMLLNKYNILVGSVASS